MCHTIHTFGKGGKATSMDFQLVTLLLLIAGSYSAQSCSVPNWKPMTLAQQAAEANIVVYGNVTAHYPMRDVPVDTAYIATMEVICVLKGEDLPPRINITEAGRLTSCHHTELPVDQEFIVLLEMDQNGVFTPDEVNYLSVAFEANDGNFQQVVDAVGSGDVGTKCPQWEGGRGGVEGTFRLNGYLKVVTQIVVWFCTRGSIIAHFQLITLLLLIAGSSVQSCKVVNWKPMTLAQQAAEANIVVYGNVPAHYPMRNVPIERAYIATMEVICVLKGEDLPPRINITEAGRLTSCHHTELPVDQEFIVLLEMDQNGVFTPDEVNHLSVAFEANDGNFQQVIDAVGSGDNGTKCPQWEGSRGGAEGSFHFNGYLKAVMQIVVWFSARSLMNIDI